MLTNWHNFIHSLLHESYNHGIYIHIDVCAQLLSHMELFMTLWTIAHQTPLSLELFRQENWSRLPFPSPGDLPNPGIKPMSLSSPAWAGGFFTIAPPGKPIYIHLKYECLGKVNSFCFCVSEDTLCHLCF